MWFCCRFYIKQEIVLFVSSLAGSVEIWWKRVTLQLMLETGWKGYLNMKVRMVQELNLVTLVDDLWCSRIWTFTRLRFMARVANFGFLICETTACSVETDCYLNREEDPFVRFVLFMTFMIPWMSNFVTKVFNFDLQKCPNLYNRNKW